MIYTLTLNPAVDYVVHLGELNTGEINRSVCESVHFGGKGINVSRVLAELGVASVASGFVAGFTGCAIEDAISSDMIAADFVHIKDGISRINVKLRSGMETDINGRGPEISKEDMELLFRKLDKLGEKDYLVMAGSVPNGVCDDIYSRIMEILYEKGTRFVVDAEGGLLMNTLKFKPFLIKPNDDELGNLFGVKINSADEARDYALKLKDMGAQNVLVSMGTEGAVLVDATGKVYFERAHSGDMINTVGAGDAMLAGFIAGYSKSCDCGYALKLGSAAGSATAFSEGLATRKQIYKLMEG